MISNFKKTIQVKIIRMTELPINVCLVRIVLQTFEVIKAKDGNDGM